jgi:hypothetical protein
VVCCDTANDKKSGLVAGFGGDFQKIRVIPEFLSHMEVNSMLFQIGQTLAVVELEIAHEYKVFPFYSFGKPESWA